MILILKIIFAFWETHPSDVVHHILTYPLGMSESSLLPGSFSTCCLIFSSRPEASAPWYWSMRTLLRKNKNVGVAEMLLVAAVAWERKEGDWHWSHMPNHTHTLDFFICIAQWMTWGCRHVWGYKSFFLFTASPMNTWTTEYLVFRLWYSRLYYQNSLCKKNLTWQTCTSTSRKTTCGYLLLSMLKAGDILTQGRHLGSEEVFNRKLLSTKPEVQLIG